MPDLNEIFKVVKMEVYRKRLIWLKMAEAISMVSHQQLIVVDVQNAENPNVYL